MAGLDRTLSTARPRDLGRELVRGRAVASVHQLVCGGRNVAGSRRTPAHAPVAGEP
jgi:hypothetical protein